MFSTLKRLSLIAALACSLTLGIYSAPASAQDFTLTDPTKQTPSEYIIEDVAVEGNVHTRTQFIINASSLVVGSRIVYPGEDISNAVQRLYNSGLFSDIQLYVSRISGNQISFLIKVVEQPRIYEYRLENIKRSERRDLRDLITLIPGTAVTEANTAQAVNTIKRFYKQKGFWFTQVNIKTEPIEDADDRVILIFEISPGERPEVKDIEFIGNESYSDRRLHKQIKPLKQDAWWRIFGKKVFKEEDYREGLEGVLSFYRNNGYADVRILKDSVYTYNYKGGKRGVKVEVTLEEGPQYKVREIMWEGNTVYTDEQLTEALGFEKGDIFNQSKYEQNISINKNETDIYSLHLNIGYLFFQAIPTITKVGEDSLDIYFDIYEDEIATIKNVSFSGNTRTHDNVVRRTLRTIPGQTYSRQSIIRSIRELSQLGYFDPASIEPSQYPNIQDKTVDITFKLDDTKSTSTFEFSGGYGGPTIGVILSSRVNFNNFSVQRAFEKGGWEPIPTGDGQQVSLGVQVAGNGYQSYSFGFMEPWFRGKPTSVGFNVSYDFINIRNTNEKNELFSSAVSVGRRLKWPDDFFVQRTIIGYQLYDVVGSASFLAEGTSSLLTLQQVIERNTLNNPISPSNGSKFSISAEVAPPLPGFSEFYKLKTEYQYHVPLVDKLVLTSQIAYGYIGYFTEDKRSDLKRFLVGGTQLQQRHSFLYDNIDMRGYPGGFTQSIAPIVDGEKVGGRMYSKYSLELRYPAVASDQIQIIPYTFVDAGNSYRNFQYFDPFDVKRSAGFGVRLFLPILGLIDLSYGYRYDSVPVPGGRNIMAGEWEFLFNIGAPF